MVLKTSVKTFNDDVLRQAVDFLKSGDVVAIPTETVYGLGGDATNDAAVAKIFEAKGRPNFNPLISHFYDLKHVLDYADLNNDALILAETLWPGPLTIIAKQKDGHDLSSSVTAGLSTIAVRVPNHDIMREIIRELGKPVAAPSANRSGSLSPTSALHVASNLNGRIPLIVAGKQSTIGLESTIIDCTNDTPVILRPGYFGSDRLSEVLGKDVPYLSKDEQSKNFEKPKSPGLLLKHYSPKKELFINSLTPSKDSFYIGFGPMIGEFDALHFINLSEEGNLIEAASNLFSYLYEADISSSKDIHIAPIPNKEIGIAINERLERACN